jgi:hypothetical protein
MFYLKSRQQLDDVQKVLSTEQIKFNDECNKLQHETHEKWMEVKRLTRELDASKKECEGLRRQYEFIILIFISNFCLQFIELLNMQITKEL